MSGLIDWQWLTYLKHVAEIYGIKVKKKEQKHIDTKFQIICGSTQFKIFTFISLDQQQSYIYSYWQQVIQIESRDL